MRLFGICADFGGSSWYRIIQPISLAKEYYEDCMWSLPERIDINYIQKADVILIQRQCHDVAFQSTQRLLNLGKIIISEIDDNIWSIPPDTENLHKFWSKDRIKGLEKILSLSNAVTVSTKPLAKIVKQFNPNVYIVPNLVVFEPKMKKVETGKIRIGWAGSESHMPDFTPDIQLALLDIKEKYKDKVDLVMFGIIPNMLFTQVSFYMFEQPQLYFGKLHNLGLDIGIVPNRDNMFNSCRSNLKFIEYSSVKAATIASSTETYRETIINGQTGILVKKNSRKEWFHAIRNLIENETERRKMADKAFDFCYKKYSVQENKQQYRIYYEIVNNIQGG